MASVVLEEEVAAVSVFTGPSSGRGGDFTAVGGDAEVAVTGFFRGSFGGGGFAFFAGPVAERPMVVTAGSSEVVGSGNTLRA